MPDRSPYYPSVSLPIALEKLRLPHEAIGQAEIDLADAFASWGYKADSGAGHRLVAALRSFGLVDTAGSGNGKRLTITGVALRHLCGSTIRADDHTRVVQDLALRPAIYRSLWERWGYDLPREEVLRQYLVDEGGFKPGAVPQLVRGYRQTLEMTKAYGLQDRFDNQDKDDTDLEFADDEIEFGYDSSDRARILVEEDTDLGLKTVLRKQNPTRQGREPRTDTDDTDLDIVIIDAPPGKGSRNPGQYLADDQIDIRFTEEDQIDIGFTEIDRVQGECTYIIDEIGSVVTNRFEMNDAPRAREIARYMVASNCNVYLSADGPVDHEAIEALISQLKLQLEFGEFDKEKEKLGEI